MTFKFLRINFEGNPNVGLYGFATDTYCLLGMELSRKISHKIKEILKTDLTVSTMSGIEFAGLFSSGNSKGLIVSKVAEDFELKKLKELGINIKVINSRETALGNLILCNDKGCLISGLLKRYKKEITDTLDCEVEIGKIADMEIVGSCAVTSNVGCLCHREASEEEMKIIEDVLKVKVDVGSVSYGSPFIKSGIIVNSKGVVFSEQTSGAEMGRIEEVLKNE